MLQMFKLSILILSKYSNIKTPKLKCIFNYGCIQRKIRVCFATEKRLKEDNGPKRAHLSLCICMYNNLGIWANGQKENMKECRSPSEK
jgi:hypothetical protein